VKFEQRSVEMKRIVILSNGSQEQKLVLAYLGNLFPECEIQVISRPETKSAEDKRFPGGLTKS
jgi:hypothetical protein